MAIVRQGILGGFRGRVGNIVGTGWKGKAVMKSLPLTVANPRTAGQVLQRGKFSMLVHLASNILASIVKPLWDRSASGMSGYNAFISANQNAFHSSGAFVADQLVISRGRMLAPTFIAFTESGSNLNVTVTNPVGDRYALPTDKIYCLVLGDDHKTPLFAGQTSATRGAGATAQFTANDVLGGADVGVSMVYCSYLRTDGSEVSNSYAREY